MVALANFKTGDTLDDGRVITWSPQEGPQHTFVGTADFEVLYGGAAGGGKSDALLGAAALQVANPRYRAIIFRRSFPELRDLMRRSKEIFGTIPGARFREGSKEWTFPSGAMLEFNYLKKKDDHLLYQGRQFQFIGWDELTQWATPDQYEYLMSRCRAPKDSGLVCMIRSTTNPGNQGHTWVRKRFKIPGEGSQTRFRVRRGKSVWNRRFIPAKIADNLYLAGTDYEDRLDAMKTHLRKMLKLGRWDVVAGAMFEEWSELHVVNSFPIPADWPIWRGGDDGFKAPQAIVWLTRSPYGRIYVIQELYASGMTAKVSAQRTLQMDRDTVVTSDGTDSFQGNQTYRGCMDSAAWNETGMGNEEGTGRAQIMNQNGAQWEPSVKTSSSRVAGVGVFSELLRVQRDGKPGIQFFRRCVNCINTIPTLPADPNNPEDVDTDADDHCWDALRSGLLWKPQVIKQSKLRGA